MLTKSRFALAAAATIVMAISFSVPASAAGKATCAQYGGDATMITEDLAKFMANAALGNSIKAAGATASGAVKMTCASSGLVTCQARQRACK